MAPLIALSLNVPSVPAFFRRLTFVHLTTTTQRTKIRAGHSLMFETWNTSPKYKTFIEFGVAVTWQIGYITLRHDIRASGPIELNPAQKTITEFVIQDSDSVYQSQNFGYFDWHWIMEMLIFERLQGDKEYQPVRDPQASGSIDTTIHAIGYGPVT